MNKIIISALLISLSTAVMAQENKPANNTSVKTIDGIVKEMLKLTSREVGEVPDLRAFRNLFLPTASFTVLNHDDAFPEVAETVSLDEFIEILQDAYYDDGFIEYEMGKVVNEYNGIAQVFQSVYMKDSENVESKGVNSYQLVYFNDRWWIANLVWTTDSNGIAIPEEYLKAVGQED